MATIAAGFRRGQITVAMQEHRARQMAGSVSAITVRDIGQQVAGIDNPPIGIVQVRSQGRHIDQRTETHLRIPARLSLRRHR